MLDIPLISSLFPPRSALIHSLDPSIEAFLCTGTENKMCYSGTSKANGASPISSVMRSKYDFIYKCR